MITIALLHEAGVADSLILKVVEIASAEQLALRRAKRAGARAKPRPATIAAPVVSAPAPEPAVAIGRKVVQPAGSTIPLDWQPDMGCVMLADIKNLSSDGLALEVKRFVDYYTSTGTYRVDWNAAFRCWLNSPYFEAAYRKKPDDKRTHFKQWADAYASLDAYSTGTGRTSWAATVQPVFAPEWR